jgi:hypothetical protein
VGSTNPCAPLASFSTQRQRRWLHIDGGGISILGPQEDSNAKRFTVATRDCHAASNSAVPTRANTQSVAAQRCFTVTCHRRHAAHLTTAAAASFTGNIASGRCCSCLDGFTE